MSSSPQRPTRAGPHEPVRTRMTVNGSPVTVELPPRVTLADALRDHLGLTGTHLGCEHGVCGMCTVLVDGSAARSCLLFACQLDGAEVVTVEGLGTPGDLHPLQDAFGRHHALQCGFCTPGFLLSAYDLLRHRPEVTADELPDELSGVLCRCTGYRTIVAAVGEVADAHRDGLPGPGNCGRRPPIDPAGSAPPGTHREPPQQPPPEGAGPDAGRQLQPPEGEPTFTVEVTEQLRVPVDRVWRVIEDVDLLVGCLPGAELAERLGDDHYRGRARVAVGPIRLSFAGLARVVERDAAGHRLRLVGQGDDSGGGRTQANVTVVAERAAEGTRLRASAEVHLTGRIAQFGRALAGDVGRRMFRQFAAAVEETASTGAAPARPPKRPRAPRSLVAAVAGRLRAAARRLRRR
jgi:xanthine dehydrogenase YagT iron-sulfur-binding subunit